ncbi:hypothetical protein HYPSUDRAFT_59722 [Hypholoma sublateritium FD-334 SS-4]|uniref:Uncharacterized protein n=1 Tax=Hypholoma sublateritium (strain FD-334 SS-4) TaxID=945553 RepID=A0A0D2N3F5_HYPSF|nr:hypothetical protein HYPSUDRAFT_59722 [Hypholoma sublateritium FD-334 SS-4]
MSAGPGSPTISSDLSPVPPTPRTPTLEDPLADVDASRCSKRIKIPMRLTTVLLGLSIKKHLMEWCSNCKNGGHLIMAARERTRCLTPISIFSVKGHPHEKTWSALSWNQLLLS